MQVFKLQDEIKNQEIKKIQTPHKMDHGTVLLGFLQKPGKKKKKKILNKCKYEQFSK